MDDPSELNRRETLGIDPPAEDRTNPQTNPQTDPPTNPLTNAEMPTSFGADSFDAAKTENVSISAEGIKRELLELKLIEDVSEWDAACREVQSTEDATAILNQITRMPSKWNTDTDEELTVLTSFQVAQILAGNARKLRYQHFVIIDWIGAGGMGEVFKARHLNLPLLVVIKTLTNVGGLVTDRDSETLRRFEREARLLTRLQHPNLPTIYHADFQNGIAFIAMQYIPGKDLQKIIAESKSSKEPIAIGWALEQVILVAEVLQFAHEKGVVHRDIKPTNIIVGADGLKLLDLGIAGLMLPEHQTALGPVTELTQGGALLGTPAFMPPEQWRDPRSVKATADIYSLGCTFFCLLTGSVPFEKTNLPDLMTSHTTLEAPPVSQKRPDCPKSVESIISKMLAKDPLDRFSSCTELAEALRAVDFSQSSSTRTRTARAAVSRKLPIGSIAAGLAVVSLLIVGALMMMPNSSAPKTRTTGENIRNEATTSSEQKDAQTNRIGSRTEITITKNPSGEGPTKTKPSLPVVSTMSIPDQAESWLQEFYSKNSDVWPDHEELVEIADGFVTPAERIDSESLDRLKRRVADLTAVLRNPFAATADFRPDTGIELKDFHAAAFLKMHEWLLHKMTGPKLLPRSLTVVVFAGEKAAPSKSGEDRIQVAVPKGVPLTLQVHSILTGHLTALILAGTGEQTYLLWQEPLKAGVPIEIDLPSVDETGKDELFFFVTKDDPIAPLFKDLDAKLLEQVAVEPGKFLVFRQEPEDLEKLVGAFRHQIVFDRVQQYLKSTKPYPFGSTDEKAKNWARVLLELEVVD